MSINISAVESHLHVEEKSFDDILQECNYLGWDALEHIKQRFGRLPHVFLFGSPNHVNNTNYPILYGFLLLFANKFVPVSYDGIYLLKNINLADLQKKLDEFSLIYIVGFGSYKHGYLEVYTRDKAVMQIDIYLKPIILESNFIHLSSHHAEGIMWMLIYFKYK